MRCWEGDAGAEAVVEKGNGKGTEGREWFRAWVGCADLDGRVLPIEADGWMEEARGGVEGVLLWTPVLARL